MLKGSVVRGFAPSQPGPSCRGLMGPITLDLERRNRPVMTVTPSCDTPSRDVSPARVSSITGQWDGQTQNESSCDLKMTPDVETELEEPHGIDQTRATGAGNDRRARLHRASAIDGGKLDKQRRAPPRRGTGRPDRHLVRREPERALPER